jgi:hypothetical protein
MVSAVRDGGKWRHFKLGMFGRFARQWDAYDVTSRHE